MRVIHVVCPFCKKHLEGVTEDDRLQGYCPACDGVFDPYAMDSRVKGSAVSRPAEYAKGPLPMLAMAMAGGLTLMALSGAIGWGASPSVQGLKAGIVAGSLACAALLWVARLGREGVAPGVFIGMAWSVCASIWLIGALVVGGGEAGFGGGVYLAVSLSCLCAFLGIHAATQMRNPEIFERVPLFLVGTLVLGIALGVVAVMLHVSPAFDAGETSPVSEPEAAAADGLT